MLLLVTMLGLSGFQVTNLEEKMASNSKDHNLAFQAAEDALRAGEGRIEAAKKLADFNGSNGLLGENDSIPDYSSDQFWLPNSGNSVEFDTSTAGQTSQLTKQPRYFIKFIGEKSADINIGVPPSPVAYFMVFSRGTGGQNSSQVFLRSFYGKRF
jgi:type IV pilus assembly protein PilX